MDRNEFMELVYETFADEPDNVLANGIIDAADAYVEHEKAQLSCEGTTFDMISKQWLLECVDEGWIKFDTEKDANKFIHLVRDIAPTAQSVATDTNVGDTISRQAARHALCKAVHKGEDIPCDNQTTSCLWTGTRVCDFEREIDALPSVQPEPSIPLSWIEKHIGWHKSLDNVFAELVAAHISVMVKKWRDEQDATN